MEIHPLYTKAIVGNGAMTGMCSVDECTVAHIIHKEKYYIII